MPNPVTLLELLGFYPQRRKRFFKSKQTCGPQVMEVHILQNVRKSNKLALQKGDLMKRLNVSVKNYELKEQTVLVRQVVSETRESCLCVLC